MNIRDNPSFDSVWIELIPKIVVSFFLYKVNFVQYFQMYLELLEDFIKQLFNAL